MDHSHDPDVAVPDLDIAVDASSRVNVAMLENAVPLVTRIALHNRESRALRHLEVTVDLGPDFADTWSAHIAAIPPGGDYHLTHVDLPLDRGRLVNLLESERGELVVRGRVGSAEASVLARRDVEVLAYNEWARDPVPQLLSAFVLPNHPAVAETLQVARALLEKETGNPSLGGYQASSGRRVYEVARAVYGAIQELGITYVNPPASFEHTGQKIRTPEQILEARMGTCLDLSTFVAACLEATGLHPLIFLVQGHAFPGVWLEERDLAEGLSDDSAKFRKLIKLGRLLAFDSSTVAARPLQPFSVAKDRAHAELEQDETFDHAVDIHGCRAQRFRPLPARLLQTSFSAAPAASAPAQAEDHRSAPVAVDVGPSDHEADTAADTPEPPGRPAGRIETWKRNLLDLTARNRLLNFRETKQTAEILCPDLGRLEDALAAGREFRLWPRPEVLSENDPRSAEALKERSGHDELDQFLIDRLDRRDLFTGISGDKVEDHLTGLYRTARESLQETGTNTLCLTLGQLAWFESDSSDKRRLAPILLVPVQLRRDAGERRFHVASSDDDTRVNVTLLEKLRHDFGLEIPGLDELPEDDSGVDVAAILRRVREAIVDMPRWDVLERAHLACVSFTKFLMWVDLEKRGDTILQNELVGHLVHGRDSAFPDQGAFPAPERMDDDHGPGELLCPLDSDSTQQVAVVAAAAPKTFVLQGPPGTGKSQTITNLIAHSVADGKRVLFVSEKRAALDVVHARLSAIGLGPYALELHSSKAKKKQVLEQLRQALDSDHLAEPASFAPHASKVAAERDHLNAYARALHGPRALGHSVFEGLGELIRHRESPAVELDTRHLETARELDRARGILARLADAAGSVAPVRDNPWRGVRVQDWQPLSSPDRCKRAIETLREAADTLRPHVATWAARLTPEHAPRSTSELEKLVELAALLGDTPRPPRALLEAPDWDQARARAQAIIDTGRDRDHRRDELASRYQPRALLALDLDHLARKFRTYANAFFLLAWLMLWSARRQLRGARTDGGRPGSREGLGDVEAALAVRDAQARLEADRAAAQALFGPAWSADTADWDALELALTWTAGFRHATEELLPHVAPGARDAAYGALLDRACNTPTSPSDIPALEDAYRTFRAQFDSTCTLLGLDGDRRFRDCGGDLLEGIVETCDGWLSALPALADWERHRAACDEADELGLSAIPAALASGELAPAQIVPAFERAFFQRWLERQIAEEPVLQRFDGNDHRFRASTFAELDRELLGLAQGAVVARVNSRTPHGASDSSAPGELGILGRELEKQRRHMPIRRLLQRIPNLIARLKPCMLMSPLSVAQYLDPEVPPFDLVVFDEASQIPTHDAVGAIARADKAVIVGDSRQLPPTAFFEQRESDDAPDDDDVEELESILNECVASGVPQLRLGWHYRSRHESLIAFSNAHYYENRLNTFPSPVDRTDLLGVSIDYVDGVYEKGKSRSNPVEAQVVVDDVVRRLLDPEECKRSVGVVTFSRAQQTRVEDLLDQAQREHPAIQPFFDDGAPEPVIVKNLENIQGDERDVILFSICYGPDAAGKLSMHFGPLNRDGGERRLNVAITRARQQLVVFSTLRPEQIDTSRTRALGVQHLKTFLEYAERGPRAIAEAVHVTGDAAIDSPFEKEVHDRLTARGWHVEPQVGCAGYRIDLGVKHPDLPGRFLLGIECDGAAYHSARTARDRDRLRAGVLEGLGWQLHRIWSTDWWQDPDREIDKVERTLEDLLSRTASTGRERPEDASSSVPTQLSSTPPVHPAGHSEKHAAASQAERPPALYARSAQPATPPAERQQAPSPSRPYEAAAISAGVRTGDQVYEAAFTDELRAQATGVVETEAPITLRLLARRIAPYWSLARTSKKLENRLQAVLRAPRPGHPHVHIQDRVLWRPDQAPDDYQAFRPPGDDPRTKRDAPDIPTEEIRNAAHHVLRTVIACDADELVRETARHLGFARTGKAVAERIHQGLELLLAQGTATRESDTITLG